MAWEGDSRHAKRAYSATQKRMLMGLNEDSYVGKIQRKRRIFFRERKLSEKRKKKERKRGSGLLRERGFFGDHRIERYFFSSPDWGREHFFLSSDGWSLWFFLGRTRSRREGCKEFLRGRNVIFWGIGARVFSERGVSFWRNREAIFFSEWEGLFEGIERESFESVREGCHFF